MAECFTDDVREDIENIVVDTVMYRIYCTVIRLQGEYGIRG